MNAVIEADPSPRAASGGRAGHGADDVGTDADGIRRLGGGELKGDPDLEWHVSTAAVSTAVAHGGRVVTLRARRVSRGGDHRDEEVPEPLVSAPDAADGVGLAEQVSMAMLVVLETLSPLERAVFVLREVFGLPHAEIASAVDRSEASVRQLAYRARGHVEARQPRFDADPHEQRAVTERFLQASLGGDIAALMEVLAPDVVMISDTGGKARANRRPVHGADKVWRLICGVVMKNAFVGYRFEPVRINGAFGVIGMLGDSPEVAGMVDVHQGRVVRILLFRNPDRLAGLKVEQR